MAISPESIAMLEASLMAGYFPASNRDIIQARGSIDQAKGSLEKIHGLIEKVQTHVQHLDRFITLKRVFLAPMRRLPVELLADIMITAQHSRHFCKHKNNSHVSILPSYGFRCLTVPLEADSTPLALSHVSRQWRRVARSCPELWASVSVQIDRDHDQDHLQRGYRLLEIHLENSGKFPLNLTLTIDRYLGWHISQLIPAHIVGLLVAETYRWRKCNLRMGTDDFDRVFTGHETFPLLTDLKIHVSPGKVQEPVFGYAPHLKRLDITGLQGKNTLVSTGIPLHDIESLVTNLPIASILSSTGFNLTRLRFRVLTDEDEDEDEDVHTLTPPVNLPPTLTDLIFDVDFVVLPNSLYSLEISNEAEFWHTRQMSAFITMLTRSYSTMTCPIQRLKLTCCHVEPVELRTLFCQFTKLSELEISLPWDDLDLSDFFRIALSLGNTLIGLPVPRLKNLHLFNNDFKFWFDCYKEPLAQLILSRQGTAIGNPGAQPIGNVMIRSGWEAPNRECSKTEELLHGCRLTVLLYKQVPPSMPAGGPWRQ
ncbi:hypothetical protein DL96DRAFT_1571881 [Flagelloscypha sp. PMI_526]|nr:hypothetical protein DL96DRAFT_1571881 [Flagelloscypha sp. PMI_526]